MQQLANKKGKLTLKEQSMQYVRLAPRTWILLFVLVLLAMPFGGVMLSFTLFAALTVFCLIVLPAFIGAAAGNLTGRTYRWCRQHASSHRL